MSFKAGIQEEGGKGFYFNRLRYPTRAQAEQYVADLKGRWTLVTCTRVDESDDPGTHEWTAEGPRPIVEKPITLNGG